MAGSGPEPFDRRSEARAFLAKAEADVRRGSWLDAALPNGRSRRSPRPGCASNPHKRPRDAAAIRAHLLPALGEMRIGQVRPSDVQAVVRRMQARRAAGDPDLGGDQRHHRPVAMPGCAAARTHRRESPCRFGRRHLPLADAMDIDYRVAVFLGALGLRQAEVFGLRVGSINFLRRTVTVDATVNEVEGQLVEGRGKTPNVLRAAGSPRRARCSPGPDRAQQPEGAGCSRRPAEVRCGRPTSGTASTRRRSSGPVSKGSRSTASATLPAT